MFVKFVAILLITVQVAPTNPSKTCEHFLNKLAVSQMNFVHCTTTSAVPVTFCVKCYPFYIEMNHAYNNLRNATNNCTDIYFDNDRLNLVSTTEATLTSVWDRGYCDDCFSNTNQSISIFDEKHTTFSGCIDEHPKDPCDQCALQYQDLNNFYIQLDQHNNGKVCFDIQDSMNRTRYQWSKKYKCCRREFNMTLFAVAISIFFSLPFVFYGGSFLVTKRQERNHGILNDEDSLFNSSTAPSTSAPISHLPRPLASSSESTNRPKTTKGFNKLNEDIDESSDEDNIAKKYFK